MLLLYLLQVEPFFALVAPKVIWRIGKGGTKAPSLEFNYQWLTNTHMNIQVKGENERGLEDDRKTTVNGERKRGRAEVRRLSNKLFI